MTFAFDCCDREAIGYVSSPARYSGDDIRDLMLESVEKRFGDQMPATPVKSLSDNGAAYTANQTRLLVRQIGLQPLTTPLCSPQTNSMAQIFGRRSNVITVRPIQIGEGAALPGDCPQA